MENIIHIVIAMAIIIAVVVAIIGLVVIVVNIRSRKSYHPVSLEDVRAKQSDVIDRLMQWDPRLRDVFRDAIQDGVTHIQHAPQDDTIAFNPDDTIAFYRAHEGHYEKRLYFLHERTATQGAKWELNWRKCEELPREAIPISEKS